MPKTDPRVIRTRRALADALVTLILERGYDSITIKDITTEAGLRRATFYLHYKDKEELLFTMLRATFDALVVQLDAHTLVPFTGEAEDTFHRIIFQHAAQHAQLYRAILNGHGSAVIVRYISAYLVDSVLVRYSKDYMTKAGGALPVDLIANYEAAVKLNLVIWWLENDMPYSVDIMVKMATRLTLDGVNGLLQDEAALLTE